MSFVYDFFYNSREYPFFNWFNLVAHSPPHKSLNILIQLPSYKCFTFSRSNFAKNFATFYLTLRVLSSVFPFRHRADLPSLQFNGYLIHHLEIIITCCTTNSPVRRALGHASNGLQWTLTAPRVGKVWAGQEGEKGEGNGNGIH